MSRQQLEEVAAEIWRNNNPSEIFEWNEEKNSFVKAFLEGFDYAINLLENNFHEIIKENCSEEFSKEIFGK